jgi:hypothetical protein
MAVQEQVTRPAPFVETLGEDLAKQVVAQTGVPIVTTGIAGLSRQPGETEAGFKARQDAARAFTTRQQSLAGLAPQVAQQTALQQRAQNIAEAQAGATGLAGFQPFLTSAQQEAQLASGLGTAALGGLGAAGTQLTQAGTTIGGVSLGAPTTQQVQAFTSPFQAQVIDATLAEFDRNKQIQQQQIRDQQAALGALGSGRAGVQLAEFGTGAARERALLQANLLQQGFQQAQAARQQDIQNRFGVGQAEAGLAQQRAALAGATQGLGGFRSALAGQQAALGQTTTGIAGANISRLGSLGALNQAQAQAELDAQREAVRMAAFQPQEQLDRYAGQVAGIMGGYPGQVATTNIPNPTPLQTALGVGTTLAGIYGGVTGKF